MSQLYDKAVYQPYIDELRAAGEKMNPYDAYYFIRPAFQVLLYVPFAWLPYPVASWLNIGLNLGLFVFLVWKLPIWFPGAPSWIRMGLLTFKPFLWSIGMGQDTLLLTLLMAYSLRLAERGRAAGAGALLATGVYKPHLVWALPVALWASGRLRMLAAFLGVGAVLGAVSFALVGPAGVRQWLDLVWDSSSDIRPDLMGNVRALGLHFGATAALAGGVLAAASAALILWRGSAENRFGAAIFASLLLSPHVYWQDYSLVALVALHATAPAPRWLLYLLFIPWIHFLPGSHMVPYVVVSLAYLCVLAARLVWEWRTAGQREPNLACPAA